MKLQDFDYYLPRELIAQYPLKRRDISRMMVLDRADRTISHQHFKGLVSYLYEGDVVVLNNTKVIPARIPCRKESGGKAEIFLINRLGHNLYEALVKPSSRLSIGKRVLREDRTILAEIVGNTAGGRIVRFYDTVDIERDLRNIGEVPLPPYIKRRPDSFDRLRYQTVYAVKDGSTAAPTAGLHFTKEILHILKRKGVDISYITLHINYGTFAPVKIEDIKKHRMYKEYFELPSETIRNIVGAKRKKKKILAVGTTTARVLESNAELLESYTSVKVTQDIKGWTDIFIYPPYKFKIVDMLLTNFHLPKSTLLMLISAFAGREFVLRAYEEAIRKRYRFYSYGDCMLII